MSRRGNDLVRRYLWMAALSALRCNPAVRALYARVVAKHPQRKAIAVGHALCKLLHLVFALGKSGRPFDRHHSPWETPAHVEAVPTSDIPVSQEDQAAGLTQTAEPARPEVTAACADRVVSPAATDEPMGGDFAHLKRQLPLERVLDQLGLTGRLRGSATPKRCACPIPRGDARDRTFRGNLQENVFQCFAAECGKKGDVIDLWSALPGMSLREAALDRVRTFHLEATP